MATNLPGCERILEELISSLYTEQLRLGYLDGIFSTYLIGSAQLRLYSEKNTFKITSIPSTTPSSADSMYRGTYNSFLVE
jgi:hypothetical protein